MCFKLFLTFLFSFTTVFNLVESAQTAVNTNQACERKLLVAKELQALGDNANSSIQKWGIRSNHPVFLRLEHPLVYALTTYFSLASESRTDTAADELRKIFLSPFDASIFEEWITRYAPGVTLRDRKFFSNKIPIIEDLHYEGIRLNRTAYREKGKLLFYEAPLYDANGFLDPLYWSLSVAAGESPTFDLHDLNGHLHQYSNPSYWNLTKSLSSENAKRLLLTRLMYLRFNEEGVVNRINDPIPMWARATIESAPLLYEGLNWLGVFQRRIMQQTIENHSYVSENSWTLQGNAGFMSVANAILYSQEIGNIEPDNLEKERGYAIEGIVNRLLSNSLTINHLERALKNLGLPEAVTEKVLLAEETKALRAYIKKSGLQSGTAFRALTNRLKDKAAKHISFLENTDLSIELRVLNFFDSLAIEVSEDKLLSKVFSKKNRIELLEYAESFFRTQQSYIFDNLAKTGLFEWRNTPESIKKAILGEAPLPTVNYEAYFSSIRSEEMAIYFSKQVLTNDQKPTFEEFIPANVFIETPEMASSSSGEQALYYKEALALAKALGGLKRNITGSPDYTHEFRQRVWEHLLKNPIKVIRAADGGYSGINLKETTKYALAYMINIRYLPVIIKKVHES